MRTRALSRAAVAAAALLSLTGAAACDRDTEERHLTEMTNEIDHLQVDRDEENKRILASDVADTHFSQVPPRLPASASPPSPAVRLGEEGAAPEEAGDTEDPSPRPTIRVVGSSRPGRVDDSSTVADDGSSPRPSALDPQAKRDYEAALALVTAKHYDRALDALSAFLVKYPDHPYADNALFWRGECLFARGDYLRASEQYEGVITRFPAGNKAPDALLKLGMAQMKLGNPAKAKEAFDRLTQSYPQSDAAHRIPPVTVQATTPPGPASEDHR
jgi:tol-pal system protein YbgF